jgi:cytochrome c
VDYLKAALSTGNTLYMPQIPLKDDEALALATFIATLHGPLAASVTQTAVKESAQ